MTARRILKLVLAVIVVCAAAWLFTKTPLYYYLSDRLTPGMRTVRSEDHTVSFKVPTSWTSEAKANGVWVYPPDTKSGKSALQVYTTDGAWLYNNGGALDGTQKSFDAWTAQPNGTTQQAGTGTTFSKVRNDTVDGKPALLFAYGTAGSADRTDVYWVRKGTKNWYVTVYDYDNLAYDDAFRAIIASLNL